MGFKQFAKSPRRHGSYSLPCAPKADTYTLAELPLRNIRTDLLDSAHDLMPRHSWQFQARAGDLVGIQGIGLTTPLACETDATYGAEILSEGAAARLRLWTDWPNPGDPDIVRTR